MHKSTHCSQTVALNSFCNSMPLSCLTFSHSQRSKKTITKEAHLVYKKKWWSCWQHTPQLPFSCDIGVGSGGNIVISEPDKAPPEGAPTRRQPHRRPNRKILSALSSEPVSRSTLNTLCGGWAEPSLTFTAQVWKEQAELYHFLLGRGLMLEVRVRSWNAAALFLKELIKTFTDNNVKSTLRWL